MQMRAELENVLADGEFGAPRSTSCLSLLFHGPPCASSSVSTGRASTAPATREPRLSPKDPLTGPGAPERRRPEADAHSGAPPHLRLPGKPADPPAWPWSPATGAWKPQTQRASPSVPAPARSTQNKAQEDCI